MPGNYNQMLSTQGKLIEDPRYQQKLMPTDTYKHKLNQAKLYEKSKPKILQKIEELEKKLGLLNSLEQKIMSIGNSRQHSRAGEDLGQENFDRVVKKWRDPMEETLVKDLYKMIRRSQAEQERLRQRLRDEEPMTEETREAIQRYLMDERSIYGESQGVSREETA
jgi:hypothetical protein